MTKVTLTLRQPLRQRLDLSPLLPERLAGLGKAAIGAIELDSGKRRLSVGEVFDIAAGDEATLVIRGRGAALDYVGRDMTRGEIGVEGDVGAYAGLAMKGGRLTVGGNAGPFAGAAMRDGILEIKGNAGDGLGGGLPGERRGMSGGLILLRGDAGARAAERLRRGVILIEGSAGDYLGARMVAGTAVVLGPQAGRHPGFAMKRGTLMLLHPPRHILPTFIDVGVHELGFVRLLARHLGAHSPRFAAAAPRLARLSRLVGDQAAAGKGEILVPAG